METETETFEIETETEIEMFETETEIGMFETKTLRECFHRGNPTIRCGRGMGLQ